MSLLCLLRYRVMVQPFPEIEEQDLFRASGCYDHEGRSFEYVAMSTKCHNAMIYSLEQHTELTLDSYLHAQLWGTPRSHKCRA